MRLISYLALCFLCVLSHASTVNSQAAKAELVGEVRDQNGELVSNSKVNLTDVSTGQTSSKLSSDGTFIITNLKPGIYNVTVEANGFKQSLREGVRLATGERSSAIYQPVIFQTSLFPASHMNCRSVEARDSTPAELLERSWRASNWRV